jgi:hypothetical protein
MILLTMHPRSKKLFIAVVIAASWLLSGCINLSFKYNKNSIDSNLQQKEIKTNNNEKISKSALHERQNKTRIIYAADQKHVAQSIVATLQDLGYQVQFSAQDLNVISGERLKHEPTKVTVTYTKQSDEFVSIRANFSITNESENIENIWYQNFFSKLNKSLFLTSNGVR